MSCSSLKLALLALLCACSLAGCGSMPAAPFAQGDPAGSPDWQRQLDALAAPDGVDPQLWAELKGALAHSLAASAPHGSSLAPESPASQVQDLFLAPETEGGIRFGWSFASQGDYDQNGEVNIADLTPVGVNFGVKAGDSGWPAAALADGDGNTEVNIADITPIGSNYQRCLQGYELQSTLTPGTESSWIQVARIALESAQPGLDTPRLQFTYQPAEPEDNAYYRVRPYDGGHLGLPSNIVRYLPPAPPEPWVRTWGSSDYDELQAVAVDEDGNVCATGHTAVFDCLTLQFTPQGTLRWVQSWGGDSEDVASDLAVNAAGVVFCAAYTMSFHTTDFGPQPLLLCYSATGQLNWARTWGPAASGMFDAIDIDSAGNLYLAGQHDLPSSGSELLVMKLSPNGSLLWQHSWDLAGWVLGDGIAVAPEGDVFVTATTEEELDMDVGFFRFSNDGALEVQKVWGGWGDEYPFCLALDAAGNALVSGKSESFGLGNDAFVVKFSPEGEVLWSTAWDSGEQDHADGLAVGPDGNIYTAGHTLAPEPDTVDILMLVLSPLGELQQQLCWSVTNYEELNGICCSGDSLYLAGHARNAGGSWALQPTGSLSQLSEPARDVSGSYGTPQLSFQDVSATVQAPIGVINSGGGYTDALLQRFIPEQQLNP